MQEIINAIVIDNDIHDIMEIATAFTSKGISTLPVHFKDPTSAYQLCASAASINPRIIITDIQMRDGGATPTTSDIANVTKCLKEAAKEISGPYIILAWTSVPSAFNTLKDYVTKAFDRSKTTMPFYFDYICKNECKPTGADFDADIILEKFSQHLSGIEPLKALLHWEKSVSKAAYESVNGLVLTEAHHPLQEVLSSLAKQVAGANLSGHESVAVNEALIHVLKDKISFLALQDDAKIAWSKALKPSQPNKLGDDAKANLNSILHFDKHVNQSIACPGDIWLIEKEGSFFQIISTKAESSDIAQKFKSEVKATPNSQMICMEISAACDFSNNKKLSKSLALGVITPRSELSNAKYKELKETENLLTIPLTFNKQPSILTVSKKYVIAATTKKMEAMQKNLKTGATIKKTTRMRENLLASWTQAIASYNSRIGTVSFH